MGFALDEVYEELGSYIENDASEFEDDMYEPSDIPEDMWDDDSDEDSDDSDDEEWEEEDF